MPVLDPRFAIPVTPQRDHGTDGNHDWRDLEPTKVVMSLGAPTLVEGKGTRYTQSGTAFIPRGYDLKHGDRIPHNGANYTVIGKARGDQDHPITGDDFGWVAFTIAGGNAAVSEQVIRHRGGGRDENSQLTPSVDTPLLAIEVVPGGGSEYVQRSRDGESTACTVYFPPGTDIVDSDELTVRDERFSVVVNDWRSVGGELEVLCTRSQG